VPSPPKASAAESPSIAEQPEPKVIQPVPSIEPSVERALEPAPEPPYRRLIPPETGIPSWAEQPEAQEALADEAGRESLKLNRAAAAGIISLALVVLLAALVLSFRREVGQTLIRLGEALSGEERKPAATQQPVTSNAPAQDSVSSQSEKTAEQTGAQVSGAQAANGAGTSQPSQSAAQTSAANSAPANSAPANSVPANPSAPLNSSATPNSSATNGVQRIQDLPPPKDGGSGQKEFEQARNILKGNHRQRDIPTAVGLLWTGVLKGYVPAEVTLADLYARGDGVSQSCAQARVLLEVAVKKGSPEARHRLDQLKRQGCP
jgi:hypothetical protein